MRWLQADTERKLSERPAIKWLLLACFTFFLGLSHLTAHSETAHASIQRIEPRIHQSRLSMDMDIDMTLSPTMKEALGRGVPLTFTIEVQIDQTRWWWFNKVLVDAQLHRRISFNALTRQWRVSIGDLGLVVASYDEALDLIRKVRGWEIAPIDRFNLDTNYVGRVRIMLDPTQLSRPLQLDANTRNGWTLTSAWRDFDFKVDRHAEENS